MRGRRLTGVEESLVLGEWEAQMARWPSLPSGEWTWIMPCRLYDTGIQRDSDDLTSGVTSGVGIDALAEALADVRVRR